MGKWSPGEREREAITQPRILKKEEGCSVQPKVGCRRPSNSTLAAA